MQLRCYTLPALIVAAGMAIPAHAGLIITPIFDSSITSNAATSAAVESTINQAIAIFESTYSNPINVTIDFESIGSGLGQSQVGFVYQQSYRSFYNALVETGANPAAIAGLTANGGNSANNPVSENGIVLVASANSRALGLTGSPLCNVNGGPGSLTCSDVQGGSGAIDGIVGLNTSITSPPNPDNGNTYSLLATTEHEIDEVLGLGSALPDCNMSQDCSGVSAASPSPEDLFRYTAAGVFASLNVSCSNVTPAYFSYTGSVKLADFNTACNGADWGDWANNGSPQDAFLYRGVTPQYGPTEIAAMSAIGYTTAAPEPSTSAMLLASLAIAALAASARRSRGAGAGQAQARLDHRSSEK